MMKANSLEGNDCNSSKSQLSAVCLAEAPGISRRLLLGAPLLGVPLLLTSCTTETLLNATFDAEPIGGPPASSQPTGTVATLPGAGSVTVVASPVASDTGHWVRIAHPSAPSPETSMKCSLSSFGGDGQYTVAASLFIPSGAGLATLQFEAFAQPVDSFLNFLHLDFMTDNTVRIDDGPTSFGSFQRDQLFSIVISLTIGASGASATISLFGAASGSLTVNVDPSLLNVARQFGALRFWMGFQWTGFFDVTDVTVLRVTS